MVRAIFLPQFLTDSPWISLLKWTIAPGYMRSLLSEPMLESNANLLMVVRLTVGSSRMKAGIDLSIGKRSGPLILSRRMRSVLTVSVINHIFLLGIWTGSNPAIENRLFSLILRKFERTRKTRKELIPSGFIPDINRNTLTGEACGSECLISRNTGISLTRLFAKREIVWMVFRWKCNWIMIYILISVAGNGYVTRILRRELRQLMPISESWDNWRIFPV